MKFIFLSLFFLFPLLISCAESNQNDRLPELLDFEILNSELEIDFYLKKISAEQRLTDSYYWYLIGRREAFYQVAYWLDVSYIKQP